MRNYLKLFVFICCFSFIGCRKEQAPKESDAQVNLLFNGHRDLFYGKLMNKYNGVSLVRIPSVARNNWYDYYLQGGKNKQNHVILRFQGPSPLTTENINKVEPVGIHYVIDGRSLFLPKKNLL